MIETIRQGLQADGITVSIAKLCRWFGVPRRTVYYKPVKSAPKVDPKFAVPIKAMIEESPSFGYRTVAHLLGFNKNRAARVPVDGLAGSQAADRVQASHPGSAFGSDDAQ
ncbi:TPA: hypothetical protein NH062_006775 [Pseudomonas aeruginosa]|nr:hypothetical protein [Pseudomonas aeruginosa]HCE9344659.1 hypothetical protein [Pseudomonas aeruginosa]